MVNIRLPAGWRLETWPISLPGVSAPKTTSAATSLFTILRSQKHLTRCRQLPSSISLKAKDSAYRGRHVTDVAHLSVILLVNQTFSFTKSHEGSRSGSHLANFLFVGSSNGFVNYFLDK